MSIILTCGVDECIIDYPAWEGYYSQVVMAIEPIELSYGWEVHNNGILFDYRLCHIDRSILTETEAANIETFLYGNRGVSINMAIGTDSNFFPFGPDKGDTGTFVVRVLDRQLSGMDQFKQFDKAWHILLVTAPEYSLPAVTNQDNFQIGTVDGLLYPQIGINPSRYFGLINGVSYGGDGYSVDTRDNVSTTSFIQTCNEGLAAELIEFLAGATGRHQDITMIAPDDYYLFGVENGGGATYTCKLIQKTIECRQLNYEEFEIPLNFYMKSAA